MDAVDTEGGNRMSDLPDSRHDLGSVQASRWTDQPEVIRLARLGVSGRATDAEDCERLLSMLGLGFTAEEIKNRLSANLSAPSSEVDR